jgi:hydroxymethylpyrimidine/phosphomethylpyrimidine kinase
VIGPRMDHGRVPNVLSVAGSDPSGGAGLQADLKTFAALEVFGCAAVSLLTAQNTHGVRATLPTPADFVTEQLRSVFDDVPIDAVKIGALGNADVVGAVADALTEFGARNVVVDPVVCSTSGRALLDADGITALCDRLLPLAAVITPNAAEAGALLRAAAPATRDEARDAARALYALGPAHVLITGGHIDDGDDCVDLLFDGRDFIELLVPRSAVTLLHGAGCTLSSAIAAFLAHGLSTAEACREAQRYVVIAIERSAALSAGGGARPLHQLGELWEHRASSTATSRVLA